MYKLDPFYFYVGRNHVCKCECIQCRCRNKNRKRKYLKISVLLTGIIMDLTNTLAHYISIYTLKPHVPVKLEVYGR